MLAGGVSPRSVDTYTKAPKGRQMVFQIVRPALESSLLWFSGRTQGKPISDNISAAPLGLFSDGEWFRGLTPPAKFSPALRAWFFPASTALLQPVVEV